MEKYYDKLKDFWNNAFILPKTETINKDDYLNLAPNYKIIDALKDLSNKNNILDYGSGYGWANIIMSKFGAKNILSADVVKNASLAANHYIKIFDAKNIKVMTVNDDYLSKTTDKFDGVFCSNVLDVLPDEIIFDIIKNLYLVTNKNALIIVSLNYYIDFKSFKISKNETIENNYLFIDDILRLNNKTDLDWINIFNKYFKIIKLKHFSWPGEKEEKRRLFYLEK